MQKQPCEPSFGADIEVFIAKADDGEIVPCVGLFPGTKQKPHTPPGWKEGFAIQEDNVMLEFNIPPATDWRTAFNHLSDIEKKISAITKEKGYFPAWKVPEHRFLAKDLRSTQAGTFGCDPDFDAYTGAKMRVNPPDFGSNRFCGGHIHLGGDFKCPDFVAALMAELFLTNYLAVSWGNKRRSAASLKLSWEELTDEDYKSIYGKKKPIFAQQRKVTRSRTDWYGMPGIFRPKPYGIEYRTPNNQWLGDNRDGVCIAGLNCATFLTNSNAHELQKIFRQIPWATLRESVLKQDYRMYNSVRTKAASLGVPV